MAESLVSVAAQHISFMMKGDWNRLSDVKRELDSLQSDLTDTMWWLVNTENKNELGLNEQVRTGLTELRMIAYEAEDVVDTFASAPASLFRFLRVNRVSRILSRLREKTKAVQAKVYLNLNESTDSPKASMTTSKSYGWQPSQGHLRPDEEYVVGIDVDISRVVQQLVGNSKPSFDVLAIVGMGGSGKTTLARKIYSHRDVKRHFPCQAWVTLSPQWDASTVLLDILRQAAGGSKQQNAIADAAETEGHGFDVIGTYLTKILKGRKFLVVLDDVWNSDSLTLILTTLIQHSSEVSMGVDKIILTSRIRMVSPTRSLKWTYHKTQGLEETESWDLFSKIAGKTIGGLQRDYEKALGKEMLRKCNGLPFAIVALATLLKRKDTLQEWERVFSQIEGPSMYRPLNDFLALSFDELPYYLKPCFLYLGLFPQGLSISAGMLTRMWVAEGFVCKDDDERTLEDAATRCLKALVDHTMVQVKKKNYAGDVKSIRVHDIMRDLCMMKAQELDFLTVFPSEPRITSTSSRRAALNLSKSVTLPAQNPHLRSLVLFGQSGTNSGVDDYINKNWKNAAFKLAAVCENYKLLRVLNISGIKTSDGMLPTGIGSLIHLRYLRMRFTNIKQLPNSVGKLFNLLTLDYRDVYDTTEVTIPNVMYKLERLTHLYLPNEMSRAHGELKFHTNVNLQTLRVKGGDWMKMEMNNLGLSIKKLYIHDISSVEQRDAVFDCPLIKTGKHLCSLALSWHGIELESLHALCSKDSLRKMRLMGRVSDKSNAISFPNYIQKLELFYTGLEKQETMAALGDLRSLKFLRLSKDSYIGAEWSCSQGAFPKLEELRLSNLPLQKWKMEKGSMLCLKKLSIVSCKHLNKVPKGIRFVSTLQQLEIETMTGIFCNRLSHAKQLKTQKNGDDYHIIQHIPNVTIKDAYQSLSHRSTAAMVNGGEDILLGICPNFLKIIFLTARVLLRILVG